MHRLHRRGRVVPCTSQARGRLSGLHGNCEFPSCTHGDFSIGMERKGRVGPWRSVRGPTSGRIVSILRGQCGEVWGKRCSVFRNSQCPWPSHPKNPTKEGGPVLRIAGVGFPGSVPTHATSLKKQCRPTKFPLLAFLGSARKRQQAGPVFPPMAREHNGLSEERAQSKRVAGGMGKCAATTGAGSSAGFCATVVWKIEFLVPSTQQTNARSRA